MLAKRDSFFIVGIGSSAGGLEALQLFLKNAPCRENLAYVIAQHLSPTHKSMLTDLLSKSSKLKTIEAQNGMAIEGGSLYVTPPNKDIKVANNIIHLLAPSGESYAAKPSINNLFRSLAYSSDSKPIGILLSGTGSDGTQGLMAIKEAGGITIVQDPKSAKYDGMPHSAIVARAADIILIPEKIGYELELIMDNFIDGTTLPMQNRGISDYSTIIEIIYKTLGIDFSGYKKNTIQRRIQRRMTTKKLNSVAQYVDYLNQNSSEVKALFQDILIGVTEFFRDKESFDALRDEIQQYIINKSEDGYLRVWIVGVSSGEEAYSIAILLKELILEHSLELTMQIFATDIDDVAISKARKGEYELTQIQNITDKDCKKYFNISDSKAHLKREVRDSVIFSKHNIITDPPFNKLDLIVCRNLLIYFESELQKKVISTFHYALKDSGILFLGKSETIGQLHYLFSPLSNTHKIFKRELSGESMRNQFLFRQQSPTQKERKPQDQLPKKSLDEQLIQSIGEHFMPKSLLVNGALDIIYLKDKIPYLDIPAGHTTLNIFKTIIPELSLELRTLIHKAKKTNGFCSGSFHKLKANNKQIMLKISVLPFAKDSSEGSTFFIINFQEENIKDFRATEPKDIETKNSEALNALQDELTRTKVHLQAVIEELETSNEELQSTNEELQSSNEELQSTNEELETSNEELQSTNEELQTTYSELKIVSEDNSQQKDLAERALSKLQIAHKETESKEHLLNGILESSLCGIAVLLPIKTPDGQTLDFKIKQLNRRAIEILKKDRESLYSGTLLQLFPEFRETGIWTHLTNPPTNGNRFEIEELILDEDRSNRWFDIVIASIDEGIVVTFHNTTKEKKYEEKLKLNLQRLNLSLQSANIGTWELCLSDDNITWDSMMYDIYGIKKGTKIDYSVWKETLHKDDIDMVEQSLQDSIENTKQFETKFRIVWSSGEIRHIYAIAKVVKLESAEMLMVGINQDITESVRLQEEVRLFEDSRTKLLKDLLLSISHHWRQPLNVISLMTLSIEEELDENMSPSLKNSINKIEEEIQYLSETVNLFSYEYASSHQGKQSLSDAINSSLKLLKPLIDENRISINTDFNGDMELNIDRSKFLEIISNLILNVSDAKQANKKDEAELLIKTRKIGSSYIITLEDDCGGINEELLPNRLFNPYITTKDKSRDKGLGLYIARYIVENDLEGSISAQNTPNGAKFIITLPMIN